MLGRSIAALDAKIGLQPLNTKLPAAIRAQLLQLLAGFPVPTFGGCSQENLRLFAIPENTLAFQIKARQFQFR